MRHQRSQSAHLVAPPSVSLGRSCEAVRGRVGAASSGRAHSTPGATGWRGGVLGRHHLACNMARWHSLFVTALCQDADKEAQALPPKSSLQHPEKRDACAASQGKAWRVKEERQTAFGTPRKRRQSARPRPEE